VKITSETLHDPVFLENSYWYFWDETWSDKHGPFSSETEAREVLESYCREVLGES